MEKVVLMYHHIGDDGAPYTVSPSDFLNHLEVIRAYSGGVILSFDDGYSSVLEVLDPIVKSGVETVVFVSPAYLGGSLEGRRMLAEEELDMLKEAGIRIGLHGYDHEPIKSREQLQDQLRKGMDRMARWLDGPIWFSFPHGVVPPYSEDVLRACGVEVAFTSEPGVWKGQFLAPRFVIRKLDSASQLERLLSRDPVYLAWTKLRRSFASLLKGLLGDRVYESIKSDFYSRR